MALDQGPLTDRLTNWDTVYAGIKAAKSSLPTFEYKIGDESEFYSMRGDFDDWGLCPRGGGHLVRMQLPITKLVYDKVKSDTQVFSDGWVEISISLKTIMRNGATEEAGDLLDIVVNTDEGEANDIISVKDLKLTPAPSKEDERWIKELFRSWLAEHLAQFRHIFCTININAKVKGEKLKWLQPSAASYAVIDDQETIESGIFGVLCMTENRPTPEDQILDPKVIPEGFPSAFLISKERFLRKLLLEQLGYLFTGPVSKDANKVWPDDYFDLASTDTIITNNAPI